MDYQLRFLAERQEDLVAAWQLQAAGWSAGKVEHHFKRGAWRRLHSGVFLLSHAPPSRNQLWRAATLTSPDSYLSHGSAGARMGFHHFERGFEVITRPGQGGRRRQGKLLVFRSTTVAEHVTRRDGVAITTAARTLIDLAPGLDPKRLGRAFRESIRLKRTTAKRIAHAVDEHPRAPGRAVLRDLATRYAVIPYHRTRSDAEGRALEILYDAGHPLPAVNVRVAGEEADLTWFDRRLIIEIDGPQFHRFRDEDARKTAVWRKAGFTVRRIPSDLVYDTPDELLVLYVAPSI